jgi:predicted small metal-binding protein
MKGGDKIMKDIRLAPGKWIYTNCGDMPSEKNCKLVIMAPADQRDDLVEAAVAHAVKSHGDKDTPELRGGLNEMIHETEVG